MPIREIGLVSFRNHDKINLKFSPNINVIWGRNGSGKTAILEAIHTLSIGRSFRTNRKKELLKDDKEFFSLIGKFGSAGKNQDIQINQTKGGARKIFIDNNKIDNIRKLVGLNPVVLLSPEEQVITKGTPQEQRNFFNKLFSVISREYFTDLSEYNRTLKQRNKLLNDFNIMGTMQAELDVWNERIARAGLQLWIKRAEYFNEFCVELNSVTKNLRNDVTFSGELLIELPDNEKDYIKNLVKTQNRDIFLARTAYGPHADKINFIFNNKNLKQYGSQGEHKLALLLIKLAEVSLIRNISNMKPIVLLDDLFAKLDDARSKQAMVMINKDLQTIITTTDIKIVEERGIDIDSKYNRSFYLE